MSELNLEPYRKFYKTNGSPKDSIYITGSNEMFEQVSQYNFMKYVGLKPTDKFLDLACGCLRGSIKLIDYLDDGNFYGADIEQSLLDAIPDRLFSEKINNKPNIFHINDYNFYELLKEKFDHILSVSLFTHLMPDVVPPLLEGIAGILKPTGTYWFTLYPCYFNDHEGDIGIAKFNREFLIHLGDKAGLKIEDIPGDYLNPSPMSNYIDRVNIPIMAQWVMKATLK